MGTLTYSLRGGNVSFLSATADIGEDLLTDYLAGNIDEALGGGSPLRSMVISSLLSGGISATKGKITGGGIKQTVPAPDAADVRKVVDIDMPDVRTAVKDMDAPDVTSGKYSLLGEMPDADGKAYERFLKEGSKEGLTQVEIIGIYKADKQRVLNMVERKKVLKKSSIENTCNAMTTIDYSYKFERELVNFNDGYEIKTTVDKDLILVQYSSDAPDASLCYWTTIDEANEIITLNDYMDRLALS